jgi:hypothetical protein
MELACPVLLVGRAYTIENAGHLTPGTCSQLDQTLSLFIAGDISHSRAARSFQILIGTSEPIHRIQAILNVSDDPLPPAPNGRCQDGVIRKKSENWTDYENLRLLAGIHKFGLGAWGTIAQFVGNSRTKAQCHQRWSRGLDPRLSRAHWTIAEDQKLQELVARLGPKRWTRISAEFGNRSDVQCRYRFQQLRRISGGRPRMPLPPIHSLLVQPGRQMTVAREAF